MVLLDHVAECIAQSNDELSTLKRCQMCVLIVLVPRLVPRKPYFKYSSFEGAILRSDVLSVQSDSVHFTNCV